MRVHELVRDERQATIAPLLRLPPGIEGAIVRLCENAVVGGG
jgi:hypothetical protein